MNNKFTKSLHFLKIIANKFGTEMYAQKMAALRTLCTCTLQTNRQLLEYHDTLLFLCAHPDDAKLHTIVEKELKRITSYLKQQDETSKQLLENEGLPYINTITRFSPDFLKWLITQKDISVTFDSFYNPSLALNDVLNITLPPLLKNETTAGLNNEELLQALHVQHSHYIGFLLNQVDQLQDQPLLKDLLMERLDVYVKVKPNLKTFSRTYNRLPLAGIFYQQELYKQFDHKKLIQEPIPNEATQDIAKKQVFIKMIRNSMAISARETDPVTYLQEDSLKIFHLERGIDLAIYGMIPQRQMPLESYVGFTLCKNGFPVSYGGAWIFGQTARIGINIFETFRGGESGFILCQLLRVYKQLFKISYVEVEPYQYGLDNPDGIKTAAFWFYYKYGFRPVDQQLLKLANSEYQKIKTRKNYRSTEKTLVKFTQSNIALNMGKNIHVQVTDISLQLKSFIKNKYQNNYLKAEQESIQAFCRLTPLKAGLLDMNERKILTDFAFWAMSMNIKNKSKLQLMKKMIFTKPNNLYAYQQLLLDFFI